MGNDPLHRPTRLPLQKCPTCRPRFNPFRRLAGGQSKIFAGFRAWLQAGGYSRSSQAQYSVGVRLALSWLDKPHPQLDPVADLDRVRAYLAQRDLSPATLAAYHKGLAKLAQYLRYRRNQPEPERAINWDKYLAPFSPDLAGDIRVYIAHRSRAWKPEQQRLATLNLLSHLTGTLRGLGCPIELTEITPMLWLDYVERRLQVGIQPATLNRELYDLQSFLQFLADTGRPVEARMLAVEPLDAGEPLPRDVPVSQLRKLLAEVESAAANQANRQAALDRAWLLLMLHSGLRTSEVRHLRLTNLDLVRRQIRLEPGKGRQARIVFLSREGVAALQAYLTVRITSSSTVTGLWGPVTVGNDCAITDSLMHRPSPRTGCGIRAPHCC